MRILLVNPPDCGRSIPEERYGISSIRQIFRGEPLALEELAGNLDGHQVRLIDLKADPGALPDVLADFQPELAGLTGVTCEARTMIRLAARIKRTSDARVVVGGIHASNDPEFFNVPEVDYVIRGLGKRVFRHLADTLEYHQEPAHLPPGALPTRPGKKLALSPWHTSRQDLVPEKPPAYHLVQRYRSHYRLERLGLDLGCVASAFGCPHHCAFCSIRGQTGGKYLGKPVEAVIRDIGLLEDCPVIRLVDANTFADIDRARALGQAIAAARINKQFLADIRSDTVVRHPELVQEWQKIGLRAVVIGFEEIHDHRLAAMDKDNQVTINNQAIGMLHSMGLTIVGDFIITPEYREEDFERLGRYIEEHAIDLPMITVMTPLPGTPLYQRLHRRITNHNLDYYTLTNAVLPTSLPEERFYSLYAGLLASCHAGGGI